MTNHQTTSCPTKAAISEQCHCLAQSSAYDGTSNAQHFAHSWSTSWPFVANNHDITSLDLTMGHRTHRIFLAIKYSCRPPVIWSLMTSNLDHASLWREVSFEDD